MEDNRYDLVLGSRYLTGKRGKSLRSFGNSVLNGAIRLTTGKRVTDSTSGMRIYGRRVLKIMAYDLNSSPEPDTLAFLLRSGAACGECQVEMRERTAGESYLNPWNSIRYMTTRTLNILLVQWFREKVVLE